MMCTPPPRLNPLPPPLQHLIEAQRARAFEAERSANERSTFQPSELSEADARYLAQMRAREELVRMNELAKYHRRQALKPAALFARLKARAARVSWDSWG